LKEYKSVQTWFSSRPYKETTKAVYKRYLYMFCGLLNQTPDQLASVSSGEALEIQIQLVTAMEQELKLKKRSIMQRLNALHGFWRANGVKLTSDVMTYKGTPTLQRLVKAPKSKRFFRKNKA
jgi:hypothetical protein